MRSRVADGGDAPDGRRRGGAMRDARRLVGVSHVSVCPVVAACFESVTDPVWLVYHAASSSVFLKTFLDDARSHANVGYVDDNLS